MSLLVVWRMGANWDMGMCLVSESVVIAGQSGDWFAIFRMFRLLEGLDPCPLLLEGVPPRAAGRGRGGWDKLLLFVIFIVLQGLLPLRQVYKFHHFRLARFLPSVLVHKRFHPGR